MVCLSKIAKTHGFSNFLAVICSKKVKNTVFFAIFEHKLFKKAEKHDVFCNFEQGFEPKRAKTRGFLQFLGQNVPAKNLLRLGRGPFQSL